MQTIYKTIKPINRLMQIAFSIRKSCLPILTAFFIAVSLVFTACDKELDPPTVFPLVTGDLSASTDVIVVDATLPGDTAVTFSWDTYPNPLVSFVMIFKANGEIDSLTLPKNTVTKTFFNSEINEILIEKLGLAIEVATDVEVSLYAYLADTSQTATSNTLIINMTAAEEIVPPGPEFTWLGIVGDATPNGWNLTNCNEMYVDVFNPYVFRYNEVLNAGEFKIPTVYQSSDWNGIRYYRPLSQGPDISETTVVLAETSSTEHSSDYKWVISEAGAYKITLDISSETISIKKFTPYSELWLVGNATPDNWNIDNPTPMVQSVDNPYEFTYEGTLNEGEFKIPTSTGNWGCDYFRPAVNHPEITETHAPFIPTQFDPADKSDYKWYITTPGNYKITLNQLYETIIIEKL